MLIKNEWLSVREAADVIGCTDARVRQMLAGGDMAGEKATASVWMIPRREVDRIARLPRRKGGRPRVGD